MFGYRQGTDYALLGVVWLHIQDRLAGCSEICHPVTLVLQRPIPLTVQLNLHAASWQLLVPDTC